VLIWLLEGAVLGIGLLFGVWFLLGLIDWLDEHFSRVTPRLLEKRRLRLERERTGSIAWYEYITLTPDQLRARRMTRAQPPPRE
jgi:hypothetical protein